MIDLHVCVFQTILEETADIRMVRIISLSHVISVQNVHCSLKDLLVLMVVFFLNLFPFPLILLFSEDEADIIDTTGGETLT